MNVKIFENKTEVLENLLREARAEADALRLRLRKYEKIILSTRLIMGHEIKKPATAISGYLDLVCEDLQDANHQVTLAFANKARDECGLLDELNSFYLELLKVDSDDDFLGKSSVNVAALLTELIGHLSPSLNATQRVKINVAKDVGLIDFNPNALNLIILNLTENALLYSSESTTVRIEIERAPNKRGMIDGSIMKIRVVDKGVGIPTEYLKKIFSPFVRLRADIAQGSGLGLTLVRSLVELNDGDIYIQSMPQKGTVVHVTIPIANAGGERRS